MAEARMEYDKDKVDELTLALLYLVIHGKEGDGRGSHIGSGLAA